MSNYIIIETLEKERKDLLKRLDAIEHYIANLKSQDTSVFKPTNSVVPIPTEVPPTLPRLTDKTDAGKYNEYSTKYTIRNKIAFILKAEGHFLYVREIATIMHRLEPDKTIDKLLGQISPTLSTLKSIDDYNITNKKVGRSNADTVWGSKSWLDANGEIKKEYMYNKEFFNNSGHDVISV